MAIAFSTSEFEFSHGRTPRGFGCWIFEVVCTSAEQKQIMLDPQHHGIIEVKEMHVSEVVQLWTRGAVTYSEAKAQVKNFLRVHFRNVTVTVCP